MDMKQLDARQQLLVIMMEECGELIQACSKALRRGELYQYSDSESQLKQEIADVYCMIELMQDWDVLSWEEIERGVERKREKLRVWSDLIEQNAAMRALEKGYAAGVSFTKEEEIYAEDIEDEVHEIEQPDPPKSNQMEMNFPSNSVTWRQALGDDPRPPYKEYTQDMTGTGDYINMAPLTPEEEKEWDRIYQKQVEESQRNGKETL